MTIKKRVAPDENRSALIPSYYVADKAVRLSIELGSSSSFYFYSYSYIV